MVVDSASAIYEESESPFAISIFSRAQFHQTESFVQSADHHNTTGQFDPSVHGFNGPLLVSLPGISADFDSMVIQTTRELEEFPFNLDMNSGSTLGIGLCNIFHLFSRLLKPPGKVRPSRQLGTAHGLARLLLTSCPF